jgi:hypothetical protein
MLVGATSIGLSELMLIAALAGIVLVAIWLVGRWRRHSL